jgi:cytochrome P450
MTEIKISDEDVEIAAEAAFWAEYRRETEDWAALAGWEKDSYRNLVRQIMAKLVASGWRREQDVLRRLEAAELVCNLVGITGSAGRSERDKALTQAWQDWSHAYGSHKRPAELPIAELAARRDEIVARTLARLRGERASEAEQYVSAGTRTDSEDQERGGEEQEHG